ncbi:MAG TPA: copper transporter [Acidimicrobiales bacterium]
MINFRFHIISLTAVFLSFAVGLVLGTNFLADASKNYLEQRIDDFEDRLNDERATNEALQEQLDSLEREDEQLDDEVGERLFTGQLTADPVLVVAPRGLQNEGGPVERVLAALEQADADTVGVWWFTDRLVLDDDDETADLAAALDDGGTDEDDPDALREALAERLAGILAAATDTDASATTDPGPDLLAAQEEPGLLTRLRDEGFLDYQAPEDSEDDLVHLPSSGLRVVIVTSEAADLTSSQMVGPLLAELAADAPVPVVVAEVPVVADDDPATEDVEPLVARLRDDDEMRERVSTVDHFDRVSGRIATILALDDAAPGGPVVGHYGLRDDADRLLPAPAE